MDTEETSRRDSEADRTRPWLFLTATLGTTWLLGFSAVLGQYLLPRELVLMLAYAGGLAPIGVASVLAWRHGPSFRRDFWCRVADPRRIGWRWVAMIVLFFPLKGWLAAWIDRALGGWGMGTEGFERLLERPLLILPTLAFWFVFGPVPEEPGWRGYALDGLQNRHGALTGSLIVGVAWVGWHLPLFFVEDTWQATALGAGTLLFWLWAANLVVESVLYTWIYNHTGRSILAAILFHFVGNAFGELFALSTVAEIADTALSFVVAAAVVGSGEDEMPQPPSGRQPRPAGLYVLIAALVFQGLSGFVGGVGLAADPSGRSLGVPLVWLEGSPFPDYQVPGIVLLTLLGIVPLLVAVGAWTGERWAWPASVLVGAALLVWIGVEVAVIGYQPEPPLQVLYGSVGLVIVGSCLLPSVRRALRLLS